MSQRRAGPCGLFSRAEEKKLSDDVIEEAFTSSATVCRSLFHANTLSVTAMRQQCRSFAPLESIAETPPNLRHRTHQPLSGLVNEKM
jgi:hypothetical protein